MRSILEELFYGNICPNTDCRSHDKETKQLMGYIAGHHDNLLSTLNDQQKEIEKYIFAALVVPKSRLEPVFCTLLKASRNI